MLTDADEQALRFGAHTNAAVVALQSGDGEALERHAAAARELAERSPYAIIRWISLYSEAWVAGIRGDLAEYERLAEAALQDAMARGQTDALAPYGAQLASIRFYQGRLPELIPMMEATVASMPVMISFKPVMAIAKAMVGDLDGARAIFEEGRAAGFPLLEDTSWSIGAAAWATLATVVGATDAIPELRAMLLPYSDQVVTTTSSFTAPIAHYLGLLDHAAGRYDEADAWFAKSAGIAERLRSPLLLAEARASWAAMLADRGEGDDRDRARELAAAALEAATAGGYGEIERTARGVLDRLG